MDIIKTDYYRSKNRGINEDDNMVRITVTMTKNEYCKFKKSVTPLSDDALLGEVRKPPLGIIPEYYFERSRIQDLARAIHEYAEDCRQGENLVQWVDELKERVLKWNRLTEKI